MTNQTAVTILKNLEQSLDDYCELNDEGKTAFHMAITALELFGNSEQLQNCKPGHWILGGYDDMYYVCDQCGYRRSDYYAKPKAKYCENCGAKMKEGDPCDV